MGPAPCPVEEGDLAAVLLDDLLDDREPEPGAAHPSRHVGLGQPLAILGQADAGIENVDHELLAFAPKAQVDAVAGLPELPDVKIEINPKDVEEGGCRGGGPGGQNVNKVETGWRLLHKPSGLQFKMTEHKSQTQNKERAWALLRSTLYQAEKDKQHAHLTASRKAMMGSGDRSQRIRTYIFPQNRCTDHRLGGEGGGEKNFNLDQVMLGQLDGLIGALLEMDKQQRLENL